MDFINWIAFLKAAAMAAVFGVFLLMIYLAGDGIGLDGKDIK